MYTSTGARLKKKHNYSVLLKTYRKSGDKVCAHFSVAANLGRTEVGPTVPMGIPDHDHREVVADDLEGAFFFADSIKATV